MYHTTATMQGKRITVYVNGDPFMKGKTVTFNQHQLPEFDTFCQFLTERVPNRYGGCYRRVCTPNGTEIRALDQIEAGHEYVACRNKYRRLGYREISEQRFNKRPKFKKIDGDRIITPVVHAPIYKDRPGRSLAEGNKRKGLTFRVILNNNDIDSASPVNVRPQDKENMDSIINEIAKITKARVHRLFSIDNEGCHGPSDFKEICDCHEFCPNMHVLVVPEGEKPTYKRYPIGGRLGFKIHTSPRTGLHYNYPDFEPTGLQFRHNLSLNRQKVLPSISSGSNKQSEAYSPFSNAGSHAGRRNKQRSRGTRQVDYDKDDAGVYRAKKQNNARGAQQEEINTKEKTTPIPPGTELNKQPSKENKQNADNQNKKNSQERVNEDAGQK